MPNKLPFEQKKRKVLARQKAKGELGTEPSKRPVKQIVKYGMINIDKPAGPTSHNVSAYVQQILGIKKAGHSGTLDPGVTGCLPVAGLRPRSMDRARGLRQAGARGNPGSRGSMGGGAGLPKPGLRDLPWVSRHAGRRDLRRRRFRRPLGRGICRSVDLPWSGPAGRGRCHHRRRHHRQSRPGSRGVAPQARKLGRARTREAHFDLPALVIGNIGDKEDGRELVQPLQRQVRHRGIPSR